MGYGLVAIPRAMWREAHVRSRQRLLCHQAGAQAKKALDAHHELTTVRRYIDRCQCLQTQPCRMHTGRCHRHPPVLAERTP